MIRDIVRQISSGIKEIKFLAINVGVVDERGEIASLFRGIPQNDLGIKTDIIDNVPKSLGMKMLIRSMSPKVIVADEIGSTEDIDAIKYGVCSGCKGLFTAHGASFEDISLNPVLKSLLNKHCFECLIFLDRKKIKEVKEKDYQKNIEFSKNCIKFFKEMADIVEENYNNITFAWDAIPESNLPPLIVKIRKDKGKYKLLYLKELGEEKTIIKGKHRKGKNKNGKLKIEKEGEER